MDLHRADKKADWARVSRRRWNVWQRLAGNTAGVVTLGNVLTIAGLLLVLAGLGFIAHEQYWQGLFLLAAGRFCDLLDGWLADKTGTKSPLGELLDATADKLETGVAVIVLVAEGLVPLPLALGVVLPHLAIAQVAYVAWRRGKKLHPSRLGKLSMAAAWGGLLLFVLAAAFGRTAGDALQLAAYLVCFASVVMAGVVAWEYAGAPGRRR